MKNKRILITGSSGFVGSALYDRLKKGKYDFIGIDKDPLMGEQKFKMNEKGEFTNFLRVYNPNIIIHCGTNSAGYYNSNFLDAYAEDSDSLINILEYLKEKEDVLLVYFSSSYVYSGCKKSPVSEYKITEPPIHNFGISKLFSEKLVSANHKNHLIFRMTNVFGPGRHRNMTTIQNWIEAGCLGKDIEVWGIGKRKLQYVFLDDVVEIVLSSDKIEPGIYNLGGDEYGTTQSIASFIANYFSTDVFNKKEKPEGLSLPFIDNSNLLSKLDSFSYSNINNSITKYIKSVN